MDIARALKSWKLTHEFKRALQYDNYTPGPVRDEMRKMGYEFITTRNWVMGIGVNSGIWVTEIRGHAFQGLKLDDFPRLQGRYAMDRARLIHAHYGKPYMP